ncbi:hypothetical protein BDM02DRAFT_3132989 [Thelephora ganbajun]|uniref:Uncharacterized protein n=1 Tax=Thelephora ganbajun TaxID=370292 RepID=A0ACB6YYV6_THEGA|nr:hypothetical protein BDM02DRAFT_3132989 [Thelephora ganbajun]
MTEQPPEALPERISENDHTVAERDGKDTVLRAAATRVDVPKGPAQGFSSLKAVLGTISVVYTDHKETIGVRDKIEGLLSHDGEVSGLLEDLREITPAYQVRTSFVSPTVTSHEPPTAEASILNNFRCAQGAEYRHGNCRGCLKGTRTAVLNEIEHWARDFDKPHVYWLNGLAGTGKSTIAQTIAERIFADGQLGASFFCSQDFEDRRNLHFIFPTIAVQLARKYAEFRSIFVPLVQSDPAIVDESLGCLKGTRTAVLNEIEHWARDFDKPHVYWLNGLAGTGKSTIAQTIAERIFADGQLGASFFCSQDFEDRRNLHFIFPTIAVQLARKYAEFRSIFVPLVQSDPAIVDESLCDQMKKLIVEPLEESAISTMIVIDALDECKDEEPASAILTILGQFVSEIPKVKFFLTGRPEPQIWEGFRIPLSAEATDMFVLHGVESSQVDSDIRLFLEQGFLELTRRRHELDGWPTKEQLDLLYSGIYLWKESPTGYILHRKLNREAGMDNPLMSPSGESIFVFGREAIQLSRTTDPSTSFSRKQGYGGFNVEFSPDETLATVAGNGGKTITVLDLKSGNPLLTIDTGMYLRGQRAGGNTVVAFSDEKAVTWNLPARDHVLSPKANKWAPCDLYRYPPTSTASPSGRTLPSTYTTCLVSVPMRRGGLRRPWFTSDGRQVWCITYEDEVDGFTIVEDSKFGVIGLEHLEPTNEPPSMPPRLSSRGYQIMDDGWILGSSGKRLLRLPPHWRPSGMTRRRTWSGRFLTLLHYTLPEAVILELEE